MSVMKPSQIVAMLALTTALCSAGLAFGQTAPASPKTIGAAAAAKSEVVPSLIVLNSRGATLQGDVLTLNGVTPN